MRWKVWLQRSYKPDSMYDGRGSINSQFLDEVVDVTAVLCAEQYSSLTIPREISDRRGP